jgi:hydrogenase maturation protease
MADKTLVLGIGNTLLSDEGVGVRMLDWMQRHFPALTGIRYLDGGTLSFTLAPYIEDADNLIVIDAAELDAAPGTVQVFADAEMDRFAGKTKRSVHEVSLGDLLAIAHLSGAMPANRALVAIQPRVVDWGNRLSNPVKQALPEVANRVLALLGDWNCIVPDVAALLPAAAKARAEPG